MRPRFGLRRFLSQVLRAQGRFEFGPAAEKPKAMKKRALKRPTGWSWDSR